MLRRPQHQQPSWARRHGAMVHEDPSLMPQNWTQGVQSIEAGMPSLGAAPPNPLAALFGGGMVGPTAVPRPPIQVPQGPAMPDHDAIIRQHLANLAQAEQDLGSVQAPQRQAAFNPREMRDGLGIAALIAALSPGAASSSFVQSAMGSRQQVRGEEFENAQAESAQQRALQQILAGQHARNLEMAMGDKKESGRRVEREEDIMRERVAQLLAQSNFERGAARQERRDDLDADFRTKKLGAEEENRVRTMFNDNWRRIWEGAQEITPEMHALWKAERDRLIEQGVPESTLFQLPGKVAASARKTMADASWAEYRKEWEQAIEPAKRQKLAGEIERIKSQTKLDDAQAKLVLERVRLLPIEVQARAYSLYAKAQTEAVSGAEIARLMGMYNKQADPLRKKAAQMFGDGLTPAEQQQLESLEANIADLIKMQEQVVQPATDPGTDGSRPFNPFNGRIGLHSVPQDQKTPRRSQTQTRTVTVNGQKVTIEVQR
jgi:hypothetical protein